MCLYSIATEYNGPLEAAHAQIDDDRYDMVECGAADKSAGLYLFSNVSKIEASLPFQCSLTCK